MPSCTCMIFDRRRTRKCDILSEFTLFPSAFCNESKDYVMFYHSNGHCSTSCKFVSKIVSQKDVRPSLDMSKLEICLDDVNCILTPG